MNTRLCDLHKSGYFRSQYDYQMNLLAEALEYLNEGARCVRAHTDDVTYIITRVNNSRDYWVTAEEPGFQKIKTGSLDPFFTNVFGVEATY